MIDLRSDTVTNPTELMRAAMAAAKVGDDAFGEDPSVALLERTAAEMLEKEAALFVATGTMANMIAVKVHTQHGDEVICAERSHIADWELGMVAWFAGCQLRQVPTENGTLEWKQIQNRIRPRRPVFAPTTLISIEHPHNMCGGTLYPILTIDDICENAHARGIKVHMDGSRIFNAAAAIGLSPARMAKNADTVMFCLSKGLGAPIGSMLAGSSDAIAAGRICRRRLGGAWRQAGILAAAGLVALEQMPQRLFEDHAKARTLAEHISQIQPLKVVNEVMINIVLVDVSETRLDAVEFAKRLKDRGVLVSSVTESRIRLVTHFDVKMSDCLLAAQSIKDLVRRICFDPSA